MGDERIGVVGAGILGLAVARELARTRPGAKVTVLEKEDRVAAHQTGHNSGVVHAGLYYTPGSLKARLCREGVALLKEYCAEHGITYDECGKLVIASYDGERDRLAAIFDKATRNGVPGLREVDRAGLREIEPHAEGVAAVHSPHTAIVDFTQVAQAYAKDLEDLGGSVLLRHPVRAIRTRASKVQVIAGDKRLFTFDRLVVCAGLTGDAVARMAGRPGDVRIIPFRGEFYRLGERARPLVRGLIYPVPDPRYPFLGVHLTKRVDGEVLAGPNAVLALSREGYRWRDVRPADLRDILTWPGSPRLAARHWRTGVKEVWGSLVKRAFVAEARRYVPELTATDLTQAPGGVRAQAVDRRGELVDDFAIDTSDRIVLVRNAPSPAATSSLAIAKYVVERAVTA
ncbi:MAG: L-2-hydroxyglutarate oxidase [Streptosporangiales bacterium]|nr:L-2-hydroxyglutarate oxidase [Streptosporangiales bacterium]